MTMDDAVCHNCGEPLSARLERCSICRKHFCPDCAFRAYGGRTFCSESCGRAYYFHGEDDDDTQSRSADDD